LRCSGIPHWFEDVPVNPLWGDILVIPARGGQSMALQPPPPRPQQPGIDVNDFFQQPANTTSIGGGTGTSVAPAPAAMDLHTQSHVQPRNTPCPPVTPSSLTQQFPRSTSCNTKEKHTSKKSKRPEKVSRSKANPTVSPAASPVDRGRPAKAA